MKPYCRPLVPLLLAGTLPVCAADPSAHNVVWTSPSADHRGSMPLGNGDISVNAWVEPAGDPTSPGGSAGASLVFYIGKTDSWDDNARLVKVGRVRVKCDPPLVSTGTTFRQELDLATGTMRVQAGHGLSLWVDANHPVIQIELEGTADFTATASVELWRTNRYELPSIETSDVMMDRSKPGNQHAPTIVEPDTLLSNQQDRIGWYHHNVKSVGPAIHAAVQDMADCPRTDPLLHRTFGAVVTAAKGTRIDDTTLRTAPGRRQAFAVHILTLHPSTPDTWLKAVDANIKAEDALGLDARRTGHAAWWQAFWQRSWIDATVGTTSEVAGSLFPDNAHPLRVGVDQAGHNKFAGEMRGVKKPDELKGSFVLEAEIKPGPRESGRIFDKITPGGSDGFLLDVQGGRNLRLICGSVTETAEDAIPADRWSKIRAVADASGWKVTVDGMPVIETGAGDGRDEAAHVSQMYALQRYITACAGRGRYPIKFNGSLFTVPNKGSPGDGDYRRWGPGYWWQNTRLPYISACTSGDTDLMEPLFRMYVDELLPVNRYRTERYFGFKDAAYYIECIHFWGDVFNESYGWQPRTERKDPLQVGGWHKWEWVAGPELVYMMLDAWEHTGDEKLLRQRIVPTARAVMRFFDHYYKTNANGALVMHPSQALETWWDCTNPMPEVAGLRAIALRLLALPESAVPAAERAYWRSFFARLPELPTREVPGGRAFAPAERFEAKRNIENPELYCVFPFRLSSFNRANAELGVNALTHRWDRGHSGWRQDDIFMAYLGLTNDARKGLVARARSHDKGSRFPAFWGPNYDWIPDQDHGGVLMKTFQSMLLQAEPATGSEVDGKIYLLPAWPANWNVAFKLHAPRATTIEGEYRDGKLIRLTVTPESRRKDVVVCDGRGRVP